MPTALQFATLPRRPHNANLFHPDSYWKKNLPAVRTLHPQSLTWRNSLLAQMDMDPNTPQSSLTPNMIAGYNPGKAWLRPDGDPLYIVDASVPLRPFRNMNAAQNGGTFAWCTEMQDVIDRLGGIPVPVDAIPSQVGDKYIFIYQPSTDIFCDLYWCRPAESEWAKMTITPSGTPTSGTFRITFNYLDNYTTVPHGWTTDPIPYNATTADIVTALQTALRDDGLYRLNAWGQFSSEPLSSTTTGGPLPSAPIVVQFPIVTAGYTVSCSVNSSTLNTGSVSVAGTTAGIVENCWGGAVLAPAGGRAGVSAHIGTYQDFVGNDSLIWEDWRWGGAATSIEYMAGATSMDEVVAANAAGTGLDHAIGILVGNAQTWNPDLHGTPYVWPAQRTDGDAWDLNEIPEGCRLAFPADTDLSFIQANYPEWMCIARTMCEKGCIIYDRTHGGVTFAFRQGGFYGGPPGWESVLTAYNYDAAAGHSYMSSLPWHKAEVIAPSFSGGPADPPPPPPPPPPGGSGGWRIGSV